ncbi:hypothetical protein LBMAG53_04720 [Planctomycetota bacterium]|nr:hypothetical protein LBMAG53_04720 [Planctomycetota bacterium]
MILPFPHLALIAVLMAGMAVALSCLPAAVGGAWRWLLALAVGGALALLAGWSGLVPWSGQLVLAWHGVLTMTGFIAAFVVAQTRSSIIGVTRRDLTDLTVIAGLFGLAGARILYLWERPGVLVDGTGQPLTGSAWWWAAVDIDRGGMVWYGGALLASLAMVIFVRWRRLPALALADLIVPVVLLGLAIGRIGCFINGCCWGKPCDLPWATWHHGVLVHPTQLYETAVCLALFSGLWWWWRHRRADGDIATAGIIAYAMWRFINEFLRDHKALVEQQVQGLTVTSAQLISIGLIVGAIALRLALAWRRSRNSDLAAAARRVPGSSHGAATAGS